MKSILVTGASGFVGRQVLKHLAKFDIDIIVVTRNEQSEYFNNIPK
ncbi:NAD-dependent epimerase/dehydratase family protein [Shewanella aestuarii]|nr:NAD-dependent epimerase/dehydratase family protein [Shewanella aestuarii]